MVPAVPTDVGAPDDGVTVCVLAEMLPDTFPAVPLPIASEAAPRREIPESVFHCNAVVDGKSTCCAAVIVMTRASLPVRKVMLPSEPVGDAGFPAERDRIPRCPAIAE